MLNFLPVLKPYSVCDTNSVLNVANVSLNISRINKTVAVSLFEHVHGDVNFSDVSFTIADVHGVTVVLWTFTVQSAVRSDRGTRRCDETEFVKTSSIFFVS